MLGREFSAGLIKRVTGKPDDELERMLSALQLAEFIYEQPAMGDVEYAFKHALTLEVGYNSVLVERRRLLHERAAQAIEALFSNRLEDHLSELAHYYDRSGNVRKAVEYLGRAGRLGAQQTAHSEAAGYFKRALELLKHLPGSTDRDRQEFDLQMALVDQTPALVSFTFGDRTGKMGRDMGNICGSRRRGRRHQCRQKAKPWCGGTLKKS